MSDTQSITLATSLIARHAGFGRFQDAHRSLPSSRKCPMSGRALGGSGRRSGYKPEER